jgi:hypothetical protein
MRRRPREIRERTERINWWAIYRLMSTSEEGRGRIREKYELVALLYGEASESGLSAVQEMYGGYLSTHVEIVRNPRRAKRQITVFWQEQNGKPDRRQDEQGEDHQERNEGGEGAGQAPTGQD